MLHLDILCAWGLRDRDVALSFKLQLKDGDVVGGGGNARGVGEKYSVKDKGGVREKYSGAVGGVGDVVAEDFAAREVALAPAMAVMVEVAGVAATATMGG